MRYPNFKKTMLPLGLILLITSCGQETFKPYTQSRHLTPDESLIKKCLDWYQKTPNDLNFLKAADSIQWSQAFLTEGSEGPIVEVPLSIPKKFIINFENEYDWNCVYRLMFKPDPENTFILFSEAICTKDTTFINSDKSFNYYQVKPHFTGYYVLMNSYNELEFAKKYLNGEFERNAFKE